MYLFPNFISYIVFLKLNLMLLEKLKPIGKYYFYQIFLQKCKEI